MKVFLIGSGGREHALAWKIAQSPKLTRLDIAPGNAGTAALGRNLPIATEDIDGLTDQARKERYDLVVIGPEAPLAAGLADRIRGAGVSVFGPSQAAARLESSKAFAKDFLARHGIPTARHRTFTDFSEAAAYARALDYPVVVKASGLAAGKGVLIPESRAETESAIRKVMLERAFGEAGDACVLEERLEGEEVSLLAFCDGKIARPMPPAQDHKRVFDGDLGPNTGGMGAYAPAPICPPAKVSEWTASILQKTVDGMRAEGVPFAGVLYAGLMVTAHGPAVIEFNCRFGDPETQVILPLLESDLLDVLDACAKGTLADADLRWKPGAAASVVLASGGYPDAYENGKTIHGLEKSSPDAVVFHAGTKTGPDGGVRTAGGRVLCVTGWGADVAAALQAAYNALPNISFEEMHFRKDIGRRALR